MPGVMCSDSMCRVAVWALQGEEEGGEGSVGGGCAAVRQLAAVGLPQLLTEAVQGSTMADQEHVEMGGGQGGGSTGQEAALPGHGGPGSPHLPATDRAEDREQAVSVGEAAIAISPVT